jgi:hypothetical protein
LFTFTSDDGKDLWNAIDNAINTDKLYQYKIMREDFIIKHFEMSRRVDDLKLQYRKKCGLYY